MKGVILAGGLGTRLHPLTKITNKHLLPVYDRPMILYPLDTLKRSGIEEIMIVCGREHAGHFMQFLGSGKEYGVKLSYALQDTNNGGIADALSYAEDFADNSPIAVILGDNLFEDDFHEVVANFKGGATAFFKKVEDPRRFGVPTFSKDGKTVIRIDEKPQNPASNFAQTGFYLVDAKIFSYIKTLKPSGRGELEMTDAINKYVREGELLFGYVQGAWLDAGTIDSLFMAAASMREKLKKQ
ncbi:MAG TPA: sugar phosphate nucleotidyltransferase [Candidatus Paceibacterota bacterium]|nr:sugar phosphate nucleotidyltransferase [Candidatus Paceibacterota bacterium]